MTDLLTSLLTRHAAACDLKQPLDRPRAEDALRRWVKAVGGPDCEVRLVSNSAQLAQAPRDALKAQAAQAARGAWAAWGAREALAARAALGAWPAGAGWEAAYCSIIAIGAESLGDRDTAAKWLPMLEAFEAGAWLVWLGDREIFYSAPPSLIAMDERRRIHAEHGPAYVWLADVKLYFWHGVLVPPEWIEDRSSLTAGVALGQQNVELRRAACEIVGWDAVLSQLNGRTIDRDDDPQIGELVEVDLPDAGTEKFLRVTCGTGRRFTIPVPPTIRTALEANAWTYDIPTDLMRQKERRT